MKRYIKASIDNEDEYILDKFIEDAKEEIDWTVSDQELIDSVIQDIVYSDYYWSMMPKSLAYYIQENPKEIEAYIIQYLK